jgi:hypothetical protein
LTLQWSDAVEAEPGLAPHFYVHTLFPAPDRPNFPLSMEDNHMPFSAGEHVAVRDDQGRAVYGQVVKRNGTVYTIRLGGANSTFEAPEHRIGPIMEGRTVGAAAYPPPSYLPGTINLDTLAYPFSNETGFRNDKFWERLRAQPITPGAVIGVSGSVFDIALGDLAACQQIISVDINRATIEAIDKLRKLLNCLRSAGNISRTKTPRTGAPTVMQISRADLLGECAAIFSNYYLSLKDNLLNEIDFDNDREGRKVVALLLELEKNCSGKLNYSQWFRNEPAIEHISSLLAAGKVSILCGDMITPEMLAAINQALDCPVSVFNMSNAIDYITDGNALLRLFSGMRAAIGAKVVTSSQRDELRELAGTFAEPKVHTWPQFIELLSDPTFRGNIGKLATGMQ